MDTPGHVSVKRKGRHGFPNKFQAPSLEHSFGLKVVPNRGRVFGDWILSGAWILVLGVFLLPRPATLRAQPAAPANRVLSLDGTKSYCVPR